MAAGHQSSNPMRKRGSIGVVLHFISHRRPCLSRDRVHLSCREWNRMLGRVLMLPPLRFGLQADARMAGGHQSSNPTRKRGRIGVMLDFISHRRPCLSRDRDLLSW